MINGHKITRTQIQEGLSWTPSMYRQHQEKYGNEWIIEEYKKSMHFFRIVVDRVLKENSELFRKLADR